MVEYAELFKAGGIWYARFTSGRSKFDALRLFGTNVIPTPYSAGMSYDDVLKDLAAIPSNRNTCFLEVSC